MSKKKIVLIYPKVEFEKNYPCSWLPYSLLSIASVVKKNDHNVEIIIFDENKNQDLDKLYEYIRIKKDDIECVGYSIMTGGGQIKNALKISRTVKSIDKNITNVFGGPHVNVLPRETLHEPSIDFILKGLGQNSVPAFVKAKKCELPFEQVPGLIGKIDGKIVTGIENQPVEKNLPPYDFSLIDVPIYIQYDGTINDRTINYVASQGCPYACRFCYETGYKRRYFKQCGNNVKKDIEYLVDNFGVNGIKFYDADWFIDTDRAISIIEFLKQKNLKWAASIHPQDILRDKGKMLEALKNSGCQRLLMGIESGSDRVLKDIIDKRSTKTENWEVAKRIADIGILGSYTFMVGFPGETKAEQQETYQFVKDLWELKPQPETRIHIYTPYPGTALYEKALHRGFMPPADLHEWSAFDYYKRTTPWVSADLESDVSKYTRQEEKREKLK